MISSIGIIIKTSIDDGHALVAFDSFLLDYFSSIFGDDFPHSFVRVHGDASGRAA